MKTLLMAVLCLSLYGCNNKEAEDIHFGPGPQDEEFEGPGCCN